MALLEPHDPDDHAWVEERTKLFTGVCADVQYNAVIDPTHFVIFMFIDEHHNSQNGSFQMTPVYREDGTDDYLFAFPVSVNGSEEYLYYKTTLRNGLTDISVNLIHTVTRTVTTREDAEHYCRTEWCPGTLSIHETVGLTAEDMAEVSWADRGKGLVTHIVSVISVKVVSTRGMQW